MSDKVEPKTSRIDEQDDGGPSSGITRKSPSIISLAIISLLNIACLALVTYHFTAHADHPAPASEMSQNMHEIPIVPAPPHFVTADVASVAPGGKADVAGNIDLVPASRQVLQIASGFDPPQITLARRQQVVPSEREVSRRSMPEPPADMQKAAEHWVQLGALSNEAMARRFWSGLEASYASLLKDRTPRIFGPDDVGGSLFHLRVGPMPDDAADGLCTKLTAAGADCFCIGPSVDRS